MADEGVLFLYEWSFLITVNMFIYRWSGMNGLFLKVEKNMSVK